MENVKRILCYGDSNTWGTIAETEETDAPSRRYPQDVRWPGVMAKALGDGFLVIEDGVEGRTTIYPSDDTPLTRGDIHLRDSLRQNRPVDLVLLKLGVSDLKQVFHPRREHLADGMQQLIDIVRSCSDCGRNGIPPEILLVAEAPILKPIGRQLFYESRGRENGCTLSREFAKDYRMLAEKNACYFADAGIVGENDPADGLHLSRESHSKVGKYLAAIVSDICSKSEV